MKGWIPPFMETAMWHTWNVLKGTPTLLLCYGVFLKPLAQGVRIPPRLTYKFGNILNVPFWLRVSSNASCRCLVPKWFWGHSVAPSTLQSWGLETSGKRHFQKGLPETHHCWRTSANQPRGLFAGCRGARRRPPNGCGATAPSSFLSHSVCAVVLWM